MAGGARSMGVRALHKSAANGVIENGHYANLVACCSARLMILMVCSRPWGPHRCPRKQQRNQHFYAYSTNFAPRISSQVVMITAHVRQLHVDNR